MSEEKDEDGESDGLSCKSKVRGRRWRRLGQLRMSPREGEKWRVREKSLEFLHRLGFPTNCKITRNDKVGVIFIKWYIKSSQWKKKSCSE